MELTTRDKKPTARLPKLEIKKFGGETKDLQQFCETLTTAIHNNKNISEIEKFTYVKHYLYNKAAVNLVHTMSQLTTRLHWVTVK